MKSRPEAEIEIAKEESEAWVSIGSMVERPLEVVQWVGIQAARPLRGECPPGCLR